MGRDSFMTNRFSYRRSRIDHRPSAATAVAALVLTLALIIGAFAVPFRAQASGAQYSETPLATYQKGGNGGFSPYWVAYIIYPAKGSKDKSVFVELNGKRLGPYEGVSGRFVVSPDGRHIAYAAAKSGKWVIAVDGVDGAPHDGLLWPYYAWSPDLEGNQFIPQTRAAALEFSPDGKSVIYPAKLENGKYAIFTNDRPGPAFPDVGAEVLFVAGQIKYFAFPGNKQIVEVHGDKVLGPYDTSYRTKVSPDGNHYIYWAKRGSQSIVVVDDKETNVAGEVGTYTIGMNGAVAYSYKLANKYRVHFGADVLPEAYDEVSAIALSPDGHKLAFWGRTGAKWALISDGKRLPGFDGPYVYRVGAIDYNVMWSADSQHLAYYAREGQKPIMVLDGQKMKQGFYPPGLALEVIVDDRGRNVGVGIMGSAGRDPALVAQAIVNYDVSKCDPFRSTFLGKQQACIDKEGKTSWFRIGAKKEGPYRDVKTIFPPLPLFDDYAYVVETDKGQQVVVNGVVSPHGYSAIYKPIIDQDAQAVVFLAVQNGKLLRVVQPMTAQ